MLSDAYCLKINLTKNEASLKLDNRPELFHVDNFHQFNFSCFIYRLDLNPRLIMLLDRKPGFIVLYVLMQSLARSQTFIFCLVQYNVLTIWLPEMLDNSVA